MTGARIAELRVSYKLAKIALDDIGPEDAERVEAASAEIGRRLSAELDRRFFALFARRPEPPRQPRSLSGIRRDVT